MKDKSALKAEIDKKFDIIYDLLKVIKSDLKLCRQILEGENESLKKIKRLYAQYELFVAEENNEQKLIESCLKSLTETI